MWVSVHWHSEEGYWFKTRCNDEVFLCAVSFCGSVLPFCYSDFSLLNLRTKLAGKLLMVCTEAGNYRWQILVKVSGTMHLSSVFTNAPPNSASTADVVTIFRMTKLV